MVNLLTGPKGSGKTQQMIERANEAVKTCEGNVFFIKKSHRDTYSLSFNIRAICMDDYDVITNTDEYHERQDQRKQHHSAVTPLVLFLRTQPPRRKRKQQDDRSPKDGDDPSFI